MEINNNQNEIKIAHIILVHQLPEQLNCLINALNHPQVHFFIHIDKKTNDTAFKSLLQKNANVSFVKERKNVIWGGFSLIEAVLEAMKEIVYAGGYTHINLISGADYPVSSPDKFVAFIAQNNKKEFFEFYPVETEWQEAIPRYTKYHFTDMNFLGKYYIQNIINAIMPKRKMPDNMTAVGRLVWFTITLELTTYFIEFLEKRKDIMNFFKLTWGTDEIIFPTLAFNSKFKDRMVNRSLRYVDFLPGKAHPKILDIHDYDIIFDREYFFARKFDPEISKELMDKIDRKINR